ncbi:ExbD/TolR family protein [Paraburkholderia silvatlantica]|uniref:Biopolymer transport protein ExbD n=1 Tax=Paraburkholderia silvatlantica TaxID=321895 RepID=A0A2U1AIN7_9BURK|nr:biopolymer transporter ExbD [Paraburkholderia silvatlantica]MBB2927575.1 biopolymer transport protein ExbD [Paraburkholderia silvatlantica]PVY36286.1 biopolymer transport protein ExbD [Paraburkholderia silvatlantica]PXW40297.1 biopolymer transport protein ExbD [Paraburkholderia silvatlantica]PYE24257.1 biopolymer transport protein ExbD [Paraburkholderia silvatlantica]TDQ97451.1 biopolymer transport protein ExbD [Paraburkholderia silvatlantica]
MNDDRDLEDEAMPAADINMTPLIDVMLVLLVIFMVTLPVLHHAAKLALPRASSQREDLAVPHVDIVVDALGHMSWNAQPVQESGLAARLAEAARLTPQPEIRLSADRATPYGRVARLLSAASAAGLAKVGFVTEPDPPRHDP